MDELSLKEIQLKTTYGVRMLLHHNFPEPIMFEYANLGCEDFGEVYKLRFTRKKGWVCSGL